MPKNNEFPSFNSKDYFPAANDAVKKKAIPPKPGYGKWKFKKYRYEDFNDVDDKWRPLFLKKYVFLNFNDGQIRALSKTCVLEVVFTRRIWPFLKTKKKTESIGHASPQRRMLLTANWTFIGNNQKLFKWIPPMGVRPRTEAWYKSRKLIIGWDLVLRTWRMISLDEFQIVNVFPIETKLQQDDFVADYKNLLKMGKQKLMRRFDR